VFVFISFTFGCINYICKAYIKLYILWGLSIFRSSSSHQTGTATSFPADNAPSQSLKGFRGDEEKMKRKQTKTQNVTEQPQDIGKINIPNVMLWMMKNAYEQSTIKKTAKLLRHLERNCNTANPEEVKLYISRKTCTNAHKENLIEAYAIIIIKTLGLTWNQPFYQRYDKKRKAPREEHIDFLINHCRMDMATKLSIIKDLGQRPIELTWLSYFHRAR
jgi:hypothetical protein